MRCSEDDETSWAEPDAHVNAYVAHCIGYLQLTVIGLARMADEHARKAADHAEYSLKYRDAAHKLHCMAADAARRLAVLEDGSIDW